MRSRNSLLLVYVRTAGAVMALLAIAGLFGLWEVRPVGIVLYLFSAVFFTYLGFGWIDGEYTRYVVGGFGMLYLLSGVLLIGMYIFDLSGNGYYDLKQGLLRVALGIASILAAYTFRYTASSTNTERQVDGRWRH